MSKQISDFEDQRRVTADNAKNNTARSGKCTMGFNCEGGIALVTATKTAPGKFTIKTERFKRSL